MNTVSAVDHNDMTQLCLICRKEVHTVNWYSYCHSCDSSFHSYHLKIWLLNHHTCPNCRGNIHPDVLAYHRMDRSIGANRVSRRLYNAGSLDLTQNRAASKSHISYFDHRSVGARNSCSCIPFKFKLFSDLSEENSPAIERWTAKLFFLLFYLLLAVYFVSLWSLVDEISFSLDAFGLVFGMIVALHFIVVLILNLATYFIIKSECNIHGRK